MCGPKTTLNNFTHCFGNPGQGVYLHPHSTKAGPFAIWPRSSTE